MRALPFTRALAAVAAAVLTATGCSSSLPRSVSNAPVLPVVTGLWPLAQVATQIGGDKVAVDDVVPPGEDPLTFVPGPTVSRAFQAAGLVLVVGGGFQPGIESASKGAPRVLQLGQALGTPHHYVWLDPATMVRAVKVIADAMAAANPAAASLYERNVGGIQSEIQSVGIDYSSTLSTCPGTTLVTPDDAFSGMAAAYGLQAHVIGPDPSPATVQAERSLVQQGRSVAALSEPWVDDSGVQALAAAAGLEIHPVDTLAGTPTSGTPAQNTYLNRMEQILSVVSGALGCNTSEQ